MSARFLNGSSLEWRIYDKFWKNKGVCFNSLKLYEEAIQEFDKAIVIQPSYYFAYHKKGNSLYNLQRYDEAIECYDKAIQKNPSDSLAWLNKGTAFCQMNEYEKAISCFDTAIELNPMFFSAFHKKVLVIYF